MSASAYATVQARTETPREIELRAFRYVNGLLTGAKGPAERAAALHKTHRLWTLLIEDLSGPGNGLPAELRGRLISLGLWAQREAMARLTDGGSLQPLVALHRDMIEGLEAQQSRATSGAAAFGARTA
ncbi:MAG: flagellar biosynthesis regulator FlaF [Acetobacteraceae bacterium]|nr:flagellar biosynthesis regulator FlaF [Acetobacteraceae bacterium]